MTSRQGRPPLSRGGAARRGSGAACGESLADARSQIRSQTGRKKGRFCGTCSGDGLRALSRYRQENFVTAPSASKSPPRLRLRLFGPFDARLHERPLPRLRTRKEQWLLALLALRCPHAVDRVWLADTLWPDSLDGAGGNLRRSLNNLRTALGADGPRITSPTPGSLALESDGCEIDVSAFDAALALDSDEALGRGGRALPGATAGRVPGRMGDPRAPDARAGVPPGARDSGARGRRDGRTLLHPPATGGRLWR